MTVRRYSTTGTDFDRKTLGPNVLTPVVKISYNNNDNSTNRINNITTIYTNNNNSDNNRLGDDIGDKCDIDSLVPKTPSLENSNSISTFSTTVTGLGLLDKMTHQGGTTTCFRFRASSASYNSIQKASTDSFYDNDNNSLQRQQKYQEHDDNTTMLSQQNDESFEKFHFQPSLNSNCFESECEPYNSCVQQCEELSFHQNNNFCCHEQNYNRTRNCSSELEAKGFYYRLLLTILVSIAFFTPTVTASCTKGTTELWAYSNPGFEEFQDSYTKYITSSKGAVCRWKLTTSKKDWIVKLHFNPFQLKLGSGSRRGDCVEIYNGDSSAAPLLDKVCDGKPKVYKSKGKHLYVVYRRGKVPGDRKIGFEYQAVDTNSNANLIRIAGIVGGSLAAIGVIYLVVRYTECCGCLRKKGGEDADNTNITGRRTNNHERDRLTIQVMEDGECSTSAANSASATSRVITTPGNRPPLSSLAANGSTTMLSSNEQNTATTANSNQRDLNAASSSRSLNSINAESIENIAGVRGAEGGGEGSGDNESDSDSLHMRNEPPPSYESLYLNEDGEIQDPPPEYTPPRHRAKNPPRRVHTFN